MNKAFCMLLVTHTMLCCHGNSALKETGAGLPWH